MTDYRQEDSTICGLTGIVGQSITAVDLKVLKQLIFVDSLRGHHSTGLCSVDPFTGVPITYKKALDGPDFLQLKGSEAILKSVLSPFIMAHNRHATRGGIGDQSAHPFTHGDITLCHNGTLDRQTNLPDHALFAVDSENICHAFDKLSPKDILPELEGAFALSWYDQSDNSFNLVRNTERPLCLAFNKNRDICYYASERKMLEAILDRNGINATYQELEAGKWIKFDLDKNDVKPLVLTIKLKDPIPPYTWPHGDYYPAVQQNYQQNKKPAGAKAPSQHLVNSLAPFGLKLGDTIEFYVEGVTTIGNAKLGIMSGYTVAQPWGAVRCYQQNDRSLAGIYTGEIVNYVSQSGESCFIVNKPVLVDLMDKDPNNFGLEKEVARVLKAQGKRPKLIKEIA
jgi:hypothetical protein